MYWIFALFARVLFTDHFLRLFLSNVCVNYNSKQTYVTILTHLLCSRDVRFNYFEALYDSFFFLNILFAVWSFHYSRNSNVVSGDPFCSVRMQEVVVKKGYGFCSYIYFKKVLCTKLSTIPIKIDSNGRRNTSHYMMSLLSVKNLRTVINVTDNFETSKESTI